MTESSIENPQSAIEPPKDVRRAYAFSVRTVHEIGITAAGEIEEAVWRIVERWNRCIPAKRIRVLNQERFRECQAVLKTWPVADILKGIEFYAAQKWQREHRAWKRFEQWLSFGSTPWIEEALNAEEAAQAAADRAASKAAELQAQTDQRLAEMRKLDALAKKVKNLPREEQARLMAQAARGLPTWMHGNKGFIMRKACELLEKAGQQPPPEGGGSE